MHAVSKAILDIAFAEEQPPVALNLVHPRPVGWNAVIESIQEALGEGSAPLRVLPFPKWFALLERRAKNVSDADIQTIVRPALFVFCDRTSLTLFVHCSLPTSSSNVSA